MLLRVAKQIRVRVGPREIESMLSRRIAAGWTVAGVVALAALQTASAAQDKAGVKGTVADDGSSTVLPIMKMAASMFKEVNPNVTVNVGSSGTGGGFKKFLDADPKLRTDISNASR